MKVFLSFLSCILAISVFTELSESVCTLPRVRKGWHRQTTTEKSLYKAAIASAMDSGQYIRFVEMHTEMQSEMEAHRQCMFVYWHRLLLLTFENMLRGQGTQYECITVPYWDWTRDHSNFVGGTCTSLYNCSSAMRDLGGVPANTATRTITINGKSVSGFCVSVNPLNHFCENRNVKGTQCVKCIPRGDWVKAVFPGSVSYASVRNQVLSGKNIVEFDNLLEYGAHNAIHGTLKGNMETFMSPADPIFWSHHAFIDLLHTIFHKCKVGEQPMTLAQKASNPVAWSSCPRRNGGTFSPYDKITMRTGGPFGTVMDGASDPVIGKYFNGAPKQFAAMMNTKDLGVHSYSYELRGMMYTMATSCSSTGRLLKDYDDFKQVDNNSADSEDSKDHKDSKDEIQYEDLTDDSDIDIELKTNATEVVTTWYDDLSKQIKKLGRNSDCEMEKIACLYQDECMGDLLEYSEIFKENFGDQVPRCQRIVNDIEKGKQTVVLPDWKKQTKKSFVCPKPKKSKLCRS